MSTDTSLHKAKAASVDVLTGVKNDALRFSDDKGNTLTLFVPPHVAATTAKAFNEAMASARDLEATE